MYFLAETLHKTVAEIQTMEFVEYQGWITYFQLKQGK